jgi:hypothetical protein
MSDIATAVVGLAAAGLMFGMARSADTIAPAASSSLRNTIAERGNNVVANLKDFSAQQRRGQRRR